MIITLIYSVYNDEITIDVLIPDASKRCKDCLVQIPSFSVPCIYRFELYRPYLQELLDFDTSARSTSGGLHSQVKDSLISDYISQGSYLESLSWILDKLFVKTLLLVILSFNQCHDLQTMIKDKCAEVLKADSHKPETLTKEFHDCVRKSTFETLLEFLHLYNSNNYSSIYQNENCKLVDIDLAKKHLDNNKWEVLVLMHKIWQKEATTYYKHISNALKRLLDDFPLIHEIFFPDKQNLKLQNVSYSMGDKHKETGSVAILTFIDGTKDLQGRANKFKLVYKPSTILIDWLINGNSNSLCDLAHKSGEDGEIAFLNSRQGMTAENKATLESHLRNLYQLCLKFKGSSNPFNESTMKSLIELFNDQEVDTSKHINVYKLLPLEDFSYSLDDLNGSHEDSASAQKDVILIKDTKNQAGKHKITLQQYMLNRMSKAYGYLEYLPSEFIQDIDQKEIPKTFKELKFTDQSGFGYVLKSEPSRKFEADFLKDLSDKNAAFNEHDVDLYSYKIGKLLEMLNLLSSTDIHLENFIIKNKDPNVIDHENSFNPTNDDAAIKIAFDDHIGGLSSTTFMEGVEIFAYFYDEGRQSMILVQEVLAHSFSRPITIEIEEGNLTAASITYSDTLKDGREFIRSTMCKNSNPPQKDQKSISQLFLGWVDAPMMREVIVREVPFATKDMFELVKGLEKSDLESNLKYLKSANILENLLFELTNETLIRDKGTYFKDISDSLFVEKSNTMIKAIAQLFDFDNPDLKAFIDPGFDSKKFLRQAFERFKLSFDYIQPLLDIIKKELGNKSQIIYKADFSKSSIRKLRKEQGEITTFTEPELRIFEEAMNEYIKLHDIVDAYLNSENNKVTAIESVISNYKARSFLPEQRSEFGKLSQVHSERPKKNPSLFSSQNPTLKLSKFESEKSAASSDYFSPETREVVAMIRSVIPEIEFVLPKEPENHTESQILQESSSEEEKKKQKAISDFKIGQNELKEGIEAYLKMKEAAVLREACFLNYINSQDVKNGSKQDSLHKILSSLSEEDIEQNSKRFIDARLEFDRVFAEIFTAFDNYIEAWESQNMKVPLIILDLLRKLYIRFFSESKKDYPNILLSDIIDMLMDGLIPAFYSLASGNYIYTPKGYNAIAGIGSGEGEYPRYKILE